MEPGYVGRKRKEGLRDVPKDVSGVGRFAFVQEPLMSHLDVSVTGPGVGHSFVAFQQGVFV